MGTILLVVENEEMFKKCRLNLAVALGSIGVFLASNSAIAETVKLSQNHDLSQSVVIPWKLSQALAVNYTDAPQYVGKNVVVSGKVVQVFVSRSNTTFLNFCADFRSCPFSAVVFAADRNEFGDLQKLEGTTVRLSGTIGTFQGRPQIILKNSNQIN